MYYNDLILKTTHVKKVDNYIKHSVLNNLSDLKGMARTCLMTQFGTSFIYFISFLLFPESHTLAVCCGVLAIITALTPVFYVWSIGRFHILFSCISIFNIAPIWFLYLEAVLPGYDAYVYSPPVYRMEAFFWVAIFLVFINLFYILLWKEGSSFSIKTFSFLKVINIKPSLYAWLTIIVFVVPLIGFYYYYGNVDRLWIFLTAGRSEKGLELLEETSGGLGVLINPLKWVFQLTPMFGAIAFVSAKNRNGLLPVISILFALIVIFVFFLSGSRGIMIFVAAPVLFFLFYYNWHRGLKFWVPAIMGFIFLIGAMEFQVRFRGNLLEVIANPEKAARENDLKSVTTFDPSKSHRDNNTYLLCLLLKGYPDRYEFRGFDGLFATLVNPIPRAVWPNKPVLGGAQDLSHQARFILDGPLFMGTTSLTFSVVGEAYMAKGVWGLLVYALIYGVFLIFFDGISFYTQNKEPLPAAMLGIGVFLAFWGFRSFFALMSFIYPIVFLIIIMSTIGFLKKIK